MSGSKDTVGMPDVRSRRSFFRLEIVSQDQPPEIKLESAPDFSHSEMRAARGPFLIVSFRRIVSLAFSPLLLWPRFVAPILTAQMECVL
jgi:hypothetical protein